MARFLLIDVLSIILIIISIYATIKDIEENGFHWFRTPFCVCWNIIAIIFFILRILLNSTSDTRK